MYAHAAAVPSPKAARSSRGLRPESIQRDLKRREFCLIVISARTLFYVHALYSTNIKLERPFEQRLFTRENGKI